MKDPEKTKDQLIEELRELRLQIASVEQSNYRYKSLAEALTKRQETYKILVENQTDIVVKVDLDGKFQYVSPSYCSTFGKTEEELLGTGFMPLVHEDDRGITKSEMEKLFEPPYCCWVEQRALTTNGWRWFGWADKAVLNENNKVVAIVAIGRDITEQKQSQHLIARLGTILDSSFNEVYAFDADTLKFIHVNQGALCNLGYTEDEIRKLTPYDINPAINKTDFPNSLLPLTTGQKKILVFEALNKRKDGTVYPVEVRLQLSKSETPAVFVAVAQDITDKKWAETGRLESIGVLAGGIAHDFNNILTGITGNISLAKMKLDTDHNENGSIKRLLEEAEKAAHQAKYLTNQLLTFAKGGEPILQIVSVYNLLQENVSFALRGSNTLCDFQLPTDLWSLKVDSYQINQVIQNLVINACQAMPQGGLIQVRAENVKAKNRIKSGFKKGLYVKISVKDHGIGIPKEILPRIFDPYFTTKPKGSGLGLAIVHSVVRKHNGYIMVESEPGSGTEFQVFLPACHDLIAQNHEKNSTSLEGKGNILLMDDENILREVVTEMLIYLGYKVTCAAEGKEAIELYLKGTNSGQPFDAVIMDLTIPGGMGGKEAIQKLIQIDPGIKAVVASGYSNDPVMARYKDYGFKDIIGKPFSIEELGRVLQGLICNDSNAANKMSG